jgi:hypothetical protein
MNKRVEIYKTVNMAKSAAKMDYANILGCSPKSLRVRRYNGHLAPNSCKCVCGETLCLELYPNNLSLSQESRLLEYQQEHGIGRNFWYGVCSSCGIKV